MQQAGRQERLRRYWGKHAGSYDRQMGFFDRRLFAGSRDWICSRATGRVPDNVQLPGMEWSPAMLQIARE